MKTASFRSARFGAVRLSKMLFAGMAFVLCVGIQGVKAQVYNQTQLPASGTGQTDAQMGGSKTYVATLLNADLVSQSVAMSTLTTALKGADASLDSGNLTPVQRSQTLVRVHYWQYLYEELEKGTPLYTLLANSISQLNFAISQVNPAHNVSALVIFQETVAMLSV